MTMKTKKSFEKKNQWKGFTLTEILMVVVIIAVMASLVMPRITGHTQKAKTSEAINILSALRRGMLSYYDEHNKFPPALSTSGVPTFKATLGIDYPQPQYGWQFKSDNCAGLQECTLTATASGDTSGTLTLQVVSGKWAGTVDYLTNTGKYWPFGNQSSEGELEELIPIPQVDEI